MSENFGLKIGLEGEKEFKKSLAEINNSFKVLGSEMKLVDSQFDKNDKSAEALTARNQVLNKEIDQQKQKIETLCSALANAAESFGENDRRTQSWQIQLNNAQAALNSMERELNSNNTALANADKGFDEAGDEAKDFSNSVKKAADTSEDADGKLSKLGDTAKKIGAALGAAAAAVGTACVAAGKKLWDMANEVGSAGDQIDKTSQKIGISAESYQKWGYVFERCGADVDNLQSGMKKLSTVITDAANGSDSAAEKLSAVGLSIEDLNGKSQDEQLSLVIAALQGMEAGAERTAAANDLLGKSATDMAAVLNITAEETERLKQEAEDYGMVMSNEAVAASAAFEDSLTKLSHTAGGLKNRMVGELLPGITQITDGLAYFPYVIGDKIHIVATSLHHIHHYIYSLSDYSQVSKKTIETDTHLQNYGVGLNYVRVNNSSSSYRWFYGTGVNGDYCNALSAFEWDDKYFVITKNPLINGSEATSTNNFGQLRVFTKDGKSTGKIWQYVADGTLTNMTAASFWGFYVDEKTNTPLVICDSCNIPYSMLALEIIKSGDNYGRYRMRFSAPTYGSNYLYSYANIIKTDGLTLPLYILPFYPYSSSNQHYLGFALGICKLCLTTINNLSEPVRKLDGQVMKITYDIVDE